VTKTIRFFEVTLQMPTQKLVKPGNLNWNAYSAMSCDTDHMLSGAGDGVLTREELEEHIRRLEDQSSSMAYMRDILEPDLRDARRALRDLNLAEADGVEYLPDNCRDLPENLRRRATEILFFDDGDVRGVITLQLLETARRRYREFGNVPSWVMRSSRDTALDELDKLEAALFPNG
jgi:hypothetical protein